MIRVCVIVMLVLSGGLLPGCSGDMWKTVQRRDAMGSSAMVPKDLNDLFPMYVREFELSLKSSGSIVSQIEQRQPALRAEARQLYQQLDQQNAMLRSTMMMNYMIYVNCETDPDAANRQWGRQQIFGLQSQLQGAVASAVSYQSKLQKSLDELPTGTPGLASVGTTASPTPATPTPNPKVDEVRKSLEEIKLGVSKLSDSMKLQPPPAATSK